MVFMGDGYTSSEIATTYTAQVQGLLGAMFHGGLLSDPFGRYKNFFNIHSIDIVSNESGADDPSKGISRDTALDAGYSGRALNVSLDKANAIESNVLRYAGFASEMRFILVNSESYGGAGYDSGIFSAGHSQAYEIALHEIGHAFAHLGDEYDDGASSPYTGADPSYVNVTTDPSGAKWSRWLGYDQPGIGVIGAYEGAYYHANGVYRPSFNSKMKTLGQPFDAVSREQFIRKFYEFVDPLDGYTDPWSTKHNLTDFYVDTIDPAVIKVDWTVDGKTVVNAGETFRVDQDYYGFGTHTVTARAYDPTDWVRGDRSALEQSVSWTVVNDHLLTGGSAADRLVGNGLSNELQGRAGSDTLDGGAGADVLIGGAGNDTYYIDGFDTLVEAAGGGVDTAYASVSYALGDSEVETLVALGSTAISLTGTGSANRLHGNSGTNTLKGQAGHDTIHGGGGNDTLWGEHGRDVFVFNSKLGTHTSDRNVNFDRLTDFKVQDDTIWLDNAVFRKLGKGMETKPVKLGLEFLSLSGDAKERDDHIIYNRKTGVLSYDADGSGKGRMVEFAQLAKNLKLTSSDFFVV